VNVIARIVRLASRWRLKIRAPHDDIWLQRDERAAWEEIAGQFRDTGPTPPARRQREES
jgi:hypothetical protein